MTLVDFEVLTVPVITVLHEKVAKNNKYYKKTHSLFYHACNFTLKMNHELQVYTYIQHTHSYFSLHLTSNINAVLVSYAVRLKKAL